MKGTVTLIIFIGLNLSIGQPIDTPQLKDATECRFTKKTCLITATANMNGTYSKMFKDMGDKCSQPASNASYKPVWIFQYKSSGSDDNLRMLMTKNSKDSSKQQDASSTRFVDLAFVQLDVMYKEREKGILGYETKNPKIRYLFATHPEEVHLVVRNGSFKDYLSLKGKPVGAWGGSYITAENFSLDNNLGFVLNPFAGEDAHMLAKKALDNKEIDAIFAVGGSPLGWINDNFQTGEYQLLPIELANLSQKAKRYYLTKLKNQNITITYSNLGTAGTFAVQSVIAVYDTDDLGVRALLTNLKRCVQLGIGDLKANGHKKWDDVDPKAKVAWEEFR